MKFIIVSNQILPNTVKNRAWIEVFLSPLHNRRFLYLQGTVEFLAQTSSKAGVGPVLLSCSAVALHHASARWKPVQRKGGVLSRQYPDGFPSSLTQECTPHYILNLQLGVMVMSLLMLCSTCQCVGLRCWGVG